MRIPRSLRTRACVAAAVVACGIGAITTGANAHAAFRATAASGQAGTGGITLTDSKPKPSESPKPNDDGTPTPAPVVVVPPLPVATPAVATPIPIPIPAPVRVVPAPAPAAAPDPTPAATPTAAPVALPTAAPQAPVTTVDTTDPAPFSSAGIAASGAEATRVFPVEQLGALTGLSFGPGLSLWVLLLTADVVAIAVLVRMMLRRRRSPDGA